ncbi:alpha/beta hydrolase [Candidatus Bathyarchaeota archaeon]|nr:alpha/beta hydrolase [Candidatus Bathyarchaeota archaeon]MBT4319315.1 alpha/beta hydrolase [Candidatus Bathyarchaeota archaeon]MBT7186539.1 alpha/beta hydrolase [Candidatus Bathyarchaeota archaeon]MBT7346184.1 alpha/beta hydrolase [Candidatus Bathyarchaeota archaeon]
MPAINSNGIDIYYEMRGEGSPLILINGWGGNLDSWRGKMIDLLSGKHRVIMMDNRGTGRSDKPDVPYTMDMMAADVKGVLDALGIKKTHVMGFSMGGAITQTFGVNYPETTLSLVVCGASAGRENSVSSDPKVQMDLALIANPSPEMTERDVTVKLLYLLYSKEYVEVHLEELVKEETYSDHPTPSHALMNQSHAISTMDTYHHLPDLKVPVLVMTGDEDVLVPPENSEKIASQIPKSELVMIPGCGHGFLKQNTEEATEHVLRFLEKVDG